MKLHTLEDLEDRHIGPLGTPERDLYETRLAEEKYAYQLGEAIKKARLNQHLTQEELGQRIGVQKSQISKLERGGSITIPTMSRVFRALGVSTASLDLGSGIGKVALW